MAADRKRSFWDMFTLIEDGKVKNTFLLYAFALSFVFLAAYGLAFALLIDPIEHLFAGVSHLLAGVLECIVPAAAGTALCLLCQKAARNKALAPAAFAFLGITVFVIGALTFAALEPQDYGMFLVMAFQVCIVPLAMGGACTGLVWRRHAKEERMIREDAQRRQRSALFREERK